MNKSLSFLCLLLTGRVVLAQEYPYEMAISRLVVAGAVSEQKAVETIVAHNGVSQGATALYTAGKSVTLQPGFVAQAGSVFSAIVTPVVSSRSVGEVPGLSVRAYPNPFAEQTTVEYTLPMTGRVRHTLLDAKGQVLRQSEGESDQPAGRHQTQIDGNALPAGVYLYTLQVGSESRTLRLLKKP